MANYCAPSLTVGARLEVVTTFWLKRMVLVGHVHRATPGENLFPSQLGGMARTYLVFGDIQGKLDALRVECTTCERQGVNHVRKLIEKCGRTGNLIKRREMLNADCPKRDAHSLKDRRDLLCPDLPKVCYSADRTNGARLGENLRAGK